MISERKKQRLLKVLRMVERPGTTGEGAASRNVLAKLMADPEVQGWLLGRLEENPSGSWLEERLSQQAEGYSILLEQQKATLERASRENARLRGEVKAARARELELRARLREVRGNPDLPPPGLSAKEWWASLVRSGDGIIFNASTMSESAGAPSRASMFRLARTLEFKETWRVAGLTPRSQKWDALEAGLSPERVADVMWLFGIEVAEAQIQTPDGRRLRAGVDFPWAEGRRHGERI